MAAKVNYRKPARLEWTDYSKLTSGIGYRRGRPCVEGNLAKVVKAYFELPPSSRATALIRTEPQAALDKRQILHASDIEAVRKRDDFPRE